VVWSSRETYLSQASSRAAGKRLPTYLVDAEEFYDGSFQLHCNRLIREAAEREGKAAGMFLAETEPFVSSGDKTQT
jgi:hypothetical protein